MLFTYYINYFLIFPIKSPVVYENNNLQDVDLYILQTLAQ